jgi:hypothetical protein
LIHTWYAYNSVHNCFTNHVYIIFRVNQLLSIHSSVNTQYVGNLHTIWRVFIQRLSGNIGYTHDCQYNSVNQLIATHFRKKWLIIIDVHITWDASIDYYQDIGYTIICSNLWWIIWHKCTYRMVGLHIICE